MVSNSENYFISFWFYFLLYKMYIIITRKVVKTALDSKCMQCLLRTRWAPDQSVLLLLSVASSNLWLQVFRTQRPGFWPPFHMQESPPQADPPQRRGSLSRVRPRPAREAGSAFLALSWGSGAFRVPNSSNIRRFKNYWAASKHDKHSVEWHEHPHFMHCATETVSHWTFVSGGEKRRPV